MSRQTILPGETQTASATGGGRMAGEDRRLQILSIAVSLFSQHGFRGTTTKEIAQAAGVSEAMVFRHFATKQELYAAILDHKACADHSFKNPLEIVADALGRKDDRAVFETLAFEALEHHEHDMQFQRLLLHSALEEHELAQMFWERTVLQVYKILGSYIRERQRDGVFRDVEPYVIVRAFIGMIIHHSLNNNLWDKKRTLLTLSNRQAAHEFTEILLSGIVSKDAVSKDARSGQSRSRKAAPPTTTTARAAAKKKK